MTSSNARARSKPPGGPARAGAPADGQAHAIAAHGAARLASVTVDSYNLEIRDRDGFVGDRASGRAFRAAFGDIRRALRRTDEDPLGDGPAGRISKARLDRALTKGDAEAAAVVHGAIETYAASLADVIRRFLRDPAWKDVARIVVGGGLRESRVGEIAVARAEMLLKADGVAIDMEMIRHHPDEAGLIGCAHLAPAWVYEGHDAILAVDVGGANIRCGVVDVNIAKSPDLAKAQVWKAQLWRHREERPGRGAAVERLTGMLADLARQAQKKGRRLCPLVGVGVPGVIEPDGSIARGAQNLPGDWESARFNLARAIGEALPELSGHETMVVIHNDAVV